MNKINKILNHDLFKECYAKIEACEKDRKFCHHDMVHFLDVARLATIFNERYHLGIYKELIYGAALLHDIGRFRQYEEGIPHDVASAQIATVILKDCGYNEQEVRYIVEAISNHRDAAVAEQDNLSGILYKADKMSRSCFACKAEKECNWKSDKKNMQLFW